MRDSSPTIKWFLRRCVAVLSVPLLLALVATPAFAHEERPVGRYGMTVGFGSEPAYAGQPNSVQVVISDAAGKPVTDLGDTLKVAVMAGGKSKELTLNPNFEVGEWGTPGDYRAFFIPTASGGYTFHLHGSIKGQAVNQRFSSSPSSFSEVEDPASASFPAAAPSSEQLAQRLDRELPRATAAAQQAVTASQAAAAKAADDAAQARLLGLAGLVTGAVGLAIACLAVTRSARSGGRGRRARLAEQGVM
jgi:hypothetical protein